jgi:ABC-2 type transport system ATP-binding protein
MLEVKSLGFGYGKSKLFDHLDLKLEGGRAYGLLGLNGAGKTSLLKLMAGALLPGSGEIAAFGRVPAKREAACLADTAFVPEDPWLPPVKAEAYLARYAVFRPAFDYARFEALRRDFALVEDKSLQKLSYGQRKKFALAAALASGARAILLDEPTNGLDIPSKMQFRKALAESVAPERIIVVSTHQVRDLESLIDPVLILDKGALAFELDSEELARRLASVRVASLEALQVVHAERDALGWNALVARPSAAAGEQAAELRSVAELRSADLELVFNAALMDGDRLAAAIAGRELGAYAEKTAYAAGLADDAAERN